MKYIQAALAVFVVVFLFYYLAVYKPGIEKRTWHELRRLHAKQNPADHDNGPSYSIENTAELKYGVLLVKNKINTLVYLGSLTPDKRLYRYPENGGLGDCIALRNFFENVEISKNVRSNLLENCEKNA